MRFSFGNKAPIVRGAITETKWIVSLDRRLSVEHFAELGTFVWSSATERTGRLESSIVDRTGDVFGLSIDYAFLKAIIEYGCRWKASTKRGGSMSMAVLSREKISYLHVIDTSILPAFPVKVTRTLVIRILSGCTFRTCEEFGRHCLNRHHSDPSSRVGRLSYHNRACWRSNDHGTSF